VATEPPLATRRIHSGACRPTMLTCFRNVDGQIEQPTAETLDRIFKRKGWI
jgi:hypothetical protein